jgi:heme-dependent oxidative N-demethylase alpha subunit-like protein
LTARQLPSETVHLPFEAGPYRMAMGLTAVPETEWFEIDALYQTELAERSRLLASHHSEVFGVEPGSEPARTETLTMMIEHLTRVYPTWFEQENGTIHNRLTGEHWDIAAHDPLEVAGRLVQEDLCLIEICAGVPHLTAAVLCFPSHWRLHEKLGHPLAEVHGRVPFYGDRLARPVDRFMVHVRPDHIASRLNWSVFEDPALFQPTGKWRTALDDSITEQNAGDRLFLRVERQTLRRLPSSGAVLFGIRVHVYPLAKAVTTSAIAAGLASAVRALPEEMAHYKSLPMFRTAMLAWLDRRAD